MDEVERKRKRAALWASWYARNPRTPEKKAKKAAHERQWRKDNPELSAQQAKDRYQRDPTATAERVKKWQKSHPEQWQRIQRSARLRRYGLTIEDYDSLHSSQEGSCAICESEDPKAKNGSQKNLDFAVDHSHTTGMVRGLLCNPCNTGLGGFRDSSELLERAIAYLRQQPPIVSSEPPKPREYASPQEAKRAYNRAYNLKASFGITLDDYEALRIIQEGACAICKESTAKAPRGGNFAVDHCHRTGVIRGLLCFPCNAGVGNFRDDPEVIKKAITYLMSATTPYCAPIAPVKRQKGRPSSKD